MVYDIAGFLDKNKDTLFQDFKRLLFSSKDSNIRAMWPEGAQDIHKVISIPLVEIEFRTIRYVVSNSIFGYLIQPILSLAVTMIFSHYYI